MPRASVASTRRFNVEFQPTTCPSRADADGKPDRKTIDGAVPDIEKQLGVFDRAYGDRNVLVGDTLTLPDLLLAPAIFYLGLFPESKALLAKVPNVTRAHAWIAQRESFKTTMPPLG